VILVTLQGTGNLFEQRFLHIEHALTLAVSQFPPCNVHGGAFVHGVAFVHARDRA
jgi:hypothetical protein